MRNKVLALLTIVLAIGLVTQGVHAEYIAKPIPHTLVEGQTRDCPSRSISRSDSLFANRACSLIGRRAAMRNTRSLPAKAATSSGNT